MRENLTKEDLIRITDYLWEIPTSFRKDMKVPARVYVSAAMLDEVLKDRSLWQLINGSTLPGVYRYVIAMPDMHEGYGFCIGEIAAFEIDNGIISPGGIGYDINCGVRLLRSQRSFAEIKNHLPSLTQAIYQEVPSGVGEGGWLKLSDKELNQVLEKGVDYALEQGWAVPADKEFCESGGRLAEADYRCVSEKAKKRGRDQLGTIGAGNHFVEVQRVAEIYNEEIAKVLGLFPDQITIMVHCGSRGLGHQVATDYIQLMNRHLSEYGFQLVDRELACAPLSSVQGKNYFAAMSAAANFAWANRQLITTEIRKAWDKVFSSSSAITELQLVYDVAHNIGKIEEYDGRKLLVHRKGATRAFASGHPAIPKKYQPIGQPVLIPGSMGTASYVLVGTEKAMTESFGSNPHGAGRLMSRTKAKQLVQGKRLKQQLEAQGISVQAGSFAGLAEEAPIAYKDVDSVVEVVSQAGIAQKVAKLVPVGVIKG